MLLPCTILHRIISHCSTLTFVSGSHASQMALASRPTILVPPEGARCEQGTILELPCCTPGDQCQSERSAPPSLHGKREFDNFVMTGIPPPFREERSTANILQRDRSHPYFKSITYVYAPTPTTTTCAERRIIVTISCQTQKHFLQL